MKDYKNKPDQNEHGKPAITVTVNNKAVTFEEQKANGVDIKAAAIAQGVQIQPDFNLFEKKGSNLKPVSDTESITLHPNQVFRAVAPDDNSMC